MRDRGDRIGRADRLLENTRYALDRSAGEFRFFLGTTPCLSALFHAGRYSELVELVGDDKFWPYRRWAARDFEERNTEFALEAGLTAMHWMVRGIGFEINEADVVAAYSRTLKAAERLDRVPEVIGRIRGMLEEAGSTKKRVLRVSVNRVAWWGPLW